MVMRAVAVTKFGEDPQLRELPDPQPGPREIVVEVAYASINPVDRLATAGALSAFTPAAFPLVMGFDGAGRVKTVGDDVELFGVGDVVYGQFGGDVLTYGTYAEQLKIVERPAFGAVQVVPEGMDLAVAAALPTVAMTADGALEGLHCTAGDSVLILGATGGVGAVATQLIARMGATVIATAKPDARAQMLVLGAHATIDYATSTVDEALRDLCPAGVDTVLDLVGDSTLVTAASHHVRDGGRVLSVAHGADATLLASDRVAVTNYVLDNKVERLHRVTRRIIDDNLTIPIAREVALDQAVSAVAPLQQGGARGKTVMRI